MNKRLCFLLAVSCVFAETQVFSQEKPIRFGVTGGMNLGSMNMNIAPYKRELATDVRAGGVFEYWVSDIFAVQTSALYQTKGASYKFDLYSYNSEMNWDLAYLSIPILGKAAWGDRVRFFIDFGPEFSFLLSATSTIKQNIPGEAANQEYDIKDKMSSVEIAGNFGLGVDFLVSDLRLFVESRGYITLNDMFANRNLDFIQVVGDASAKHFGGSLSLGILF